MKSQKKLTLKTLNDSIVPINKRSKKYYKKFQPKYYKITKNKHNEALTLENNLSKSKKFTCSLMDAFKNPHTWGYHKRIIYILSKRSNWRYTTSCSKSMKADYCNVEEFSKIRSTIKGYFFTYDKSSLANILSDYQGRYIPVTYNIRNRKILEPDDSELSKNNDDIWFLKPLLKSRGRGIRVTKNPRKLLRRIGKGRYILQRGVRDLLLINDRKFDLRVWIIFMHRKNGPIQVFMYKDGPIKITVNKFNKKTVDPKIHITNFDYQKKLDGYTKNKNVDAFSNIPNYEKCLENLVTACKEMMPKLAERLTPDSNRPGYYLGACDFIFDSNLNPWLLEINFNPGFSCVNRRVNVYKQLFRDMIDLAIEPLITGNEIKLGNFEKIH